MWWVLGIATSACLFSFWMHSSLEHLLHQLVIGSMCFLLVLWALMFCMPFQLGSRSGLQRWVLDRSVHPNPSPIQYSRVLCSPLYSLSYGSWHVDLSIRNGVLDISPGWSLIATLLPIPVASLNCSVVMLHHHYLGFWCTAWYCLQTSECMNAPFLASRLRRWQKAVVLRCSVRDSTENSCHFW